MAWYDSLSGPVVRACESASCGKRSQKSVREQLRSALKKRRTVTKSVVRRPQMGRSVMVRVYRLWIRLARLP